MSSLNTGNGQKARVRVVSLESLLMLLEWFGLASNVKEEGSKNGYILQVPNHRGHKQT